MALNFRIATYATLVLFSGMNVTAQDHRILISAWLQEHRTELALTQADVSGWTITDASTSPGNGADFIYIQQFANGLAVHNAVANFAVRGGRVVHFGDRLIRDLASNVSAPVPALDAAQALRAAADQLGLSVAGSIRTLRSTGATSFELDPSGISQDPITAELIYQPIPGEGILLAWDLTIRSLTGHNWWHLAVDAHTGRILRNNDYIVECAVPAGSFAKHERVTLERQQFLPAMFAAPAPDGYRVFAMPTESPNHGSRTMVNDPAEATASPFGWHDEDGVAGAEHTITRGNNVYASEDGDADNVPGYSPDGGPSLEFDFPLDLAQEPNGYFDASITNLFYWCNILHDVWYAYGFDEASGNFQTTNYSGQGLGNDQVIAEGQDGGGTGNANFASPPDGENGRMQMYNWGGPSITTSLTVNSPVGIAGDYAHELAAFGPNPPAVPLTTDMVLVVDDTAPVNDGCGVIVNGAELVGKIVLVDRGACPFTVKVQAIQDAGGAAVVVANNVAGAPIAQGGTSTTISIPSVMISNTNGALIKSTMLDGAVNATLQSSSASFEKDGDLDNGVIAHEYGHGVSIRLTGGPANSDCLGNDEQMGEGWSDWIALMMTLENGDQGTDPRGIATYVSGQTVTGGGIRPAHYSTAFAVNDYTYDATNDAFEISQPHGVGFIWATMLWDLTWALIDEYGFDPDAYHGTGGNNIAMHLVIDGMKLQPCGPGFVDARDAILAADDINFAGANNCLIWRAFAARGLGVSADQGDPQSRSDQDEAFDVPPSCLTEGVGSITPLNDATVSVLPNPTSGLLSVVLGVALLDPLAVNVFSADGRVVRSAVMKAGQTSISIDLSDHAPATYMVELRGSGSVVRRSVVVVH